MMRPAILTIACAVCGACAAPAAALPPSPSWLAARLIGDSGGKALASPAEPARGEPSPGSATPERRGRSGAAAKAEAEHSQAPDSFVGAIRIYPWTDGALYRLQASPGAVSDIELQPGENLVSVAAGDTVRWVIGDTASGAGIARRTHVLVKPAAGGLATNILIATDRRIYHVEARSVASPAMAGIAWSYPDDPLLAIKGAAGEAPGVAAGIAVEQLNFGYRIEGDRPEWRPIRAFDDGRQLFIQFPANLGRLEAPPLFVTGEGGRAELVNYRVRGHYYVVDRLFAAGELRLGERHQQVVRIVRDDVGARRRGS